MKNLFITFILFVFSFSSVAQARTYEVPPTSSTRSHVPWIPDEEMEKCVKLYNEAEWFGEEIDRTSVNQYSQSSVDNYNSMIDSHSGMINAFNRDCAGKQSETAYRAAQKLNSQNNG